MQRVRLFLLFYFLAEDTTKFNLGARGDSKLGCRNKFHLSKHNMDENFF